MELYRSGRVPIQHFFVLCLEICEIVLLQSWVKVSSITAPCLQDSISMDITIIEDMVRQAGCAKAHKISISGSVFTLRLQSLQHLCCSVVHAWYPVPRS